MPSIVTREEWGAGLDLEHGWMTNDELPQPLQPRGIVIHHTEPDHPTRVTSQDHVQAFSARERVRYWHAYHVEKRRWSDIAYHFLIGPDGTLFEGRRGAVRGAHAVHNNDRAMGIALLGNFCIEAPPLAALESLVELVRWACNQWAVDPQASMEWIYTFRDGAVKTVTAPTVVGHCDIRETLCPGEVLHDWIADLRTLI